MTGTTCGAFVMPTTPSGQLGTKGAFVVWLIKSKSPQRAEENEHADRLIE